MSDFIDDNHLLLSPRNRFHEQNRINLNLDKKNNSTINKNDVLKNLHKLVPNLTTDYFIQFINQSNSDLIKIKLCINNCGFGNLDALIDLKINFSGSTFQASLSIVQEQKLYKISSSYKRILICKLFSKSSTKNSSKFSVCLNRGTIRLLNPSIQMQKQEFNQFLLGKLKQKNLISLIKVTLKQGIQNFKPLLRQLIEDFETDFNQIRAQSQDSIKRSIYRYIMKSSIEPSFEVSFGSGKYQMIECLSREEVYYTNQLAQNIVTDLSEFESHSFYLTPKVPLEGLKKLYAKEYFMSNDEELNSLKMKIEPPGSRMNLGLESKYVYNMIEINQSNPINLRKINMGGFSDISISEVQFWYMLTASSKRLSKLEEIKLQKQEILNQAKVKRQTKKILVFKSNKYTPVEGGRNRIAHEMKIVSKFKGTPSIFIPEYFKVTNQRSPFGQYVIMEHLPYPTLNEYAQIHKNSISFLTKIHLASLIIQGIQILKNNGIVHMDLKPSNIIIGKRMIVKLIDFGQSFSKGICEPNYKPAFSNPYGSPQIADKAEKINFTQKNDVYSWAVVVWELLFRKFPFYLPLQKTIKALKARNYGLYSYYVPEEESQYGSWQIMPLLRSLLLKAMDKEISNRPFTIWLSVVLKECLSHLISLELSSLNE